MEKQYPIITLEIDLKNPIAEIREIIQAMSDFADRLEEIQKEYEESEGFK